MVWMEPEAVGMGVKRAVGVGVVVVVVLDEGVGEYLYVKFVDSTMALRMKAVPVSRWHHVQWQQWTMRGFASIVYVSALQVHWPWRGSKDGEDGMVWVGLGSVGLSWFGLVGICECFGWRLGWGARVGR